MRIVAMLMIIILHILGGNGLLEESNLLSFNIAWVMEIFCLPAVNCFGLIAGYCDKGHSLPVTIKKIISLWVGVAFYTVPCNLVRIIMCGGTNPAMYKLAFPIISTRYWYFNAYIVVAILVSLIKPELDKLKNSYVFLLCGVSFIVATLESTIGIELLNLKNGYSPMWVLLLYLWGVWTKKIK